MPQEMIAAFRAKGARTSPVYKAAAVVATLVIQLYTISANRSPSPALAYGGKK
eukprot:SAG31_NODE_17339_length_674_cov_1.516522_2_plen_53_part_00